MLLGFAAAEALGVLLLEPLHCAAPPEEHHLELHVGERGEVAPVLHRLPRHIGVVALDEARLGVDKLHLAAEEGSKEHALGTGHGVRLTFQVDLAHALTLLHLHQSVALHDEVGVVFACEAVLPPLEVLHQRGRPLVLVSSAPRPHHILLVRTGDERRGLVYPLHLLTHPVVDLPQVEVEPFGMTRACHHDILLLDGLGGVDTLDDDKPREGKEELHLHRLRIATTGRGIDEHAGHRLQFGDRHRVPVTRHVQVYTFCVYQCIHTL